jgi:hypothetical protein
MNKSSPAAASGRNTKGRLVRSASVSSTSTAGGGAHSDAETAPHANKSSTTEEFQAELKALVEYKTPDAPRFRIFTDIKNAVRNSRAFTKGFVLPGLALSVVAVAVLTVVVLECDLGFLADFKESQEMVMLQQRYYEPFKSFFTRNFFARS